MNTEKNNNGGTEKTLEKSSFTRLSEQGSRGNSSTNSGTDNSSNNSGNQNSGSQDNSKKG